MGKSTEFQAISAAVMTELRAITGEAHFFTDESAREAHSHDETEDLRFLPQAVAEPADTAQVSAIMRICNRERIPVTVRGGGSGLAGGALPVHGGLVLSMRRFDQILKIDKRNFQVHVQPGVITEHLQNTLREAGLFYPPDPSSRGWSFIGGNISTNAGGPKAVKYGVVKDHVLNLEVVLPNGEVIETGANTLKNSTGYNLTQLIVGSEGTLGVVTKIVLKLQPHPTQSLLMLAPFRSAESACEASNTVALLASPVTPAIQVNNNGAIRPVRKGTDTGCSCASAQNINSNKRGAACGTNNRLIQLRTATESKTRLANSTANKAPMAVPALLAKKSDSAGTRTGK